MPVHTNGEIKANRPDIVINDKKGGRCMLIDITVSSERNTSAKFTEKLSKYKDLEIGCAGYEDGNTTSDHLRAL